LGYYDFHPSYHTGIELDVLDVYHVHPYSDSNLRGDPAMGLDRLGNEVEHSFTDPEIYYKPWTQYSMLDKDSKDSSKGRERKCVAAGINELKPELKEYTLPFSTENFEVLFKETRSIP
jgi:hypothetical protein